MKIELKIPEIGESITEGYLVGWNKKEGDIVQVDDELYELETDKITLTVQSEHEGQLHILVDEENDVAIGQVVATVDTDVKAKKVETVIDQAPPISAPAGKAQMEESLQSEKVLDQLAPSVRKLVVENKIDPESIDGSGKNGRIIKEDVLNKIKDEQKPLEKEKVVVSTPPVVDKKQVETGKIEKRVDSKDRQIRKPMSRLRQRISERLLMSQNNTATLTTFNEVDMSAVMTYRKKFQEIFIKKHGVKLGFMSFFVKAVVEALKYVPAVNNQIDGNDVIENNFYDIGIAVSTEQGLVVPILRDADKLTFAEIEIKIAELGKKARERKLTLKDLQGGTFTISNGGIFGSMMSTPILNPPQSAILGMHAIKKRPVIVGEDDHIEVRPMMYLAVSYDHRIIDGAESVTFLKHIIDCLENPERIMLEI